jgi:hypothetical protein
MKIPIFMGMTCRPCARAKQNQMLWLLMLIWKGGATAGFVFGLLAAHFS